MPNITDWNADNIPRFDPRLIRTTASNTIRCTSHYHGTLPECISLRQMCYNLLRVENQITCQCVLPQFSVNKSLQPQLRYICCLYWADDRPNWRKAVESFCITVLPSRARRPLPVPRGDIVANSVPKNIVVRVVFSYILAGFLYDDTQFALESSVGSAFDILTHANRKTIQSIVSTIPRNLKGAHEEEYWYPHMVQQEHLRRSAFEKLLWQGEKKDTRCFLPGGLMKRTGEWGIGS